MVVSLMLLRIAELKVADRIETSNAIKKLKNLSARIVYKTVSNIANIRLCTFADAAHPTNRYYRQQD